MLPILLLIFISADSRPYQKTSQEIHYDTSHTSVDIYHPHDPPNFFLTQNNTLLTTHTPSATSQDHTQNIVYILSGIFGCIFTSLIILVCYNKIQKRKTLKKNAIIAIAEQAPHNPLPSSTRSEKAEGQIIPFPPINPIFNPSKEPLPSFPLEGIDTSPPYKKQKITINIIPNPQCLTQPPLSFSPQKENHKVNTQIIQLAYSLTSDDDPSSRSRTLEKLKPYGNHKDIRPQLLNRLFNDPYGDNRQQALQALTQAHDRSIIHFLLKAAKEEKDPQVLFYILKDIGMLHYDNGETYLFNYLKTSDNIMVKTGAILGLSFYRNEKITQKLIQLLDTNPCYRIRKTIAIAIAKTENTTNYARLIKLATNDTHPDVRIRAVVGIARFQDPQALPCLKKILLTDKNLDVKKKAVDAYLKIKNNAQGSAEIFDIVLNISSACIAYTIQRIAATHNPDHIKTLTSFRNNYPDYTSKLNISIETLENYIAAPMSLQDVVTIE